MESHKTFLSVAQGRQELKQQTIIDHFKSYQWFKGISLLEKIALFRIFMQVQASEQKIQFQNLDFFQKCNIIDTLKYMIILLSH